MRIHKRRSVRRIAGIMENHVWPFGWYVLLRNGKWIKVTAGKAEKLKSYWGMGR